MDKLPLFREIDVDFNTFMPKLGSNGDCIVLSGKDALVIWISKALSKHSARFGYSVYSSSYGNELAKLIGATPELAKAIAPDLIRECLIVNPYIIDVTDFEIEHSGSTLYADFTVKTIYGEALFKGKEISLV